MAKKGFIARMIEGPERSESYARSTLPTNRWSLGWDVFKTNKGKLFWLNLLTLLCALPLIAIFVLRYVYKTAQVVASPITANLSGYPVYPATVGLEAQITLSINFRFFLIALIGILFLAIGVSGGFYVMRNMVWAEGVMIASDFWKGIKQNFFTVLFSLLFYFVMLALSTLSINMASLMLSTGQGIRWLLIIAQVLSYVIIAIVTMMVMYMVTLGVTYKMSFLKLIRNSFILSIALIPTNVFFIAFAALFFFLMWLGKSMPILLVIFGFIVVIWGFSLFMLIWTDYSHWVFDTYINDKVPGAKKNRGIYKPQTEEQTDGEAEVIERSKLVSKPVKPITDSEIEIYELPTSFTRADLEKLEATKRAMREDSDKYVEEHSGDIAPTIDELMNSADTPKKKDDADTDDAADKKNKKKNKK